MNENLVVTIWKFSLDIKARDPYWGKKLDLNQPKHVVLTEKNLRSNVPKHVSDVNKGILVGRTFH